MSSAPSIPVIPARRHRRALWLALAVIGLGAGAALLWRIGQSPGTPRLALDRREIALGNVNTDTVVNATFTLTNEGTAPLVLDVAPRIETVQGC